MVLIGESWSLFGVQFKLQLRDEKCGADDMTSGLGRRARPGQAQAPGHYAGSCQPLRATTTPSTTPTTSQTPSATLAMAALPSLPPMGSSDSFNPDLQSPIRLEEDGTRISPIDPVPLASSEPHDAPQDTHTQQRVQEALHSDIGVGTLLGRLKASIASARVGAPPSYLTVRR
jgi:hypothetical protein